MNHRTIPRPSPDHLSRLWSSPRWTTWWTRSVGRRFGLGFALVLLLMVGTLAVDVNASNYQGQLANRLSSHLIPQRVAAQGIIIQVRSTDDDGAWFVMTRNAQQAAQLRARYYNDLKDLDATVQTATALADTAAQGADLRRFRQFWYGTQGAQEANGMKVALAAQRIIRERGVQATLASIGVLAGYDGYLSGNEQSFAEKAEGRYQKALDFYVSIPFIPSLDAILAYQADAQREIDQGQSDAAAAANLVRTLSLSLGALSVILGVLIALGLTRSVVRPLQRLTAASKQVAMGNTGNMVALIDVARADEIGALAQAFSTMVADTKARTNSLVEAEAQARSAEEATREAAGRLERGVTQLIEDLAPAAEGDLTVRPHLSADAGDIAVVADFTGVLIGSFAGVARLVRDAAGRVQADADRLSGRVAGLTAAVAERTVQINETAAVAGGIADSAGEVLLSVEQVKGATHEAVASVEQGNRAVAQTLERMDAMRAVMIGATRQIKRLSDSSLAMNSTVGLVLQFAGDLELLADNAQIEAARHSEAGGVFTAVAEQTGRLAEDAQKALNDIQTAVLTNRQETAEVGRQMEQMATEVVSGARAVEEARAAFGAITRTVRELDGFVARVDGVARAQVEVANTVGAAMGQIAGFFDQTATDVRLSEDDASGLRHTIDDLRASIVTLKVEVDDTATPRAA